MAAPSKNPIRFGYDEDAPIFQEGIVNLFKAVFADVIQHALHCLKADCPQCAEDSDWLFSEDEPQADNPFHISNTSDVLGSATHTLRTIYKEARDRAHSGTPLRLIPKKIGKPTKSRRVVSASWEWGPDTHCH